MQIIVDISQILGSLSLVVSVVLLIRELRETNRLTRASNTQTLVALSSPFNLSLIQDRKMAEFYVHGPQAYAEMDEIDRYRYRSLLIWWLIFHENVYFQWRQRLLDKHTFKAWSQDLKAFIRHQQLAALWDSMKDLFQDEFANYVDQLMEEGRRSSASPGTNPRPVLTSSPGQVRPGNFS